MKKLALASFALFILFGCKDDLQDNSPALQGIKDGDQLWRADFFAADIDFGGFLIEGVKGNETLQLVTRNDIAGTYELGPESQNVALFRDENGVVYSTANQPDPSVSLYPTDGQIIIDNVTGGSPKTLIGTYWFHAYTADGLNTVSFIDGVVYRTKLVGGLVVIDNGSACLQASQALFSAQSNFNGTDITMPEYTDICNAYKDALNGKINACGDSSGNLQAIIDSLGDCM